MISPYEILAFAIALPFVIFGVWLDERFAAEGPREIEFEAWCQETRPVLFEIHALPEESAALEAALRSKIGKLCKVQHDRGQYPWSRYAFTVSVENEDGVVRARATRATMRRVRQAWPELGATLDQCLLETGLDGTAWVHTELREGDDARGMKRRGRGWNATVKDGVMESHTLS